jgi:hypothetical protein
MKNFKELLLVLSFVSMLVILGCNDSDKGVFESTGEKMDSAVQKTGEWTGEAVENTGKGIKNAADATGKFTEKTVTKTENVLNGKKKATEPNSTKKTDPNLAP